jgi:hypothetical protein
MTWWSRLELFVRQYRVKRLDFGSGSWFVVEDGVGSFKEVLFAVRQGTSGSHATLNAEARDSFHPSVNIHVPHTS